MTQRRRCRWSAAVAATLLPQAAVAWEVKDSIEDVAWQQKAEQWSSSSSSSSACSTPPASLAPGSGGTGWGTALALDDGTAGGCSAHLLQLAAAGAAAERQQAPRQPAQTLQEISTFPRLSPQAFGWGNNKSNTARQGPDGSHGYGMNPEDHPFNRIAHPGAAERVHTIAKDSVLPTTAIFMLAILVSSYLGSHRWTRFIPETLTIVAVAGLLGLLIRHMLVAGVVGMESFELVNATVLNLVLLPIIIFNGGWSIHLPHFSSQFSYCLIFAVGGTIVTMMVIGYSEWLLANHLGWPVMRSLRANMAFAAAISATDPVATLATFGELQIAYRQPLLNTLVLGESLINDAVAIVFFSALNTLDKLSWNGLEAGIMERMLILLFGSALLGILMSMLLIVLMRWAGLPGNTIIEILYMFMAPFLIFSFADAVELSGIIAVLFAGIMFKTYGSKHLNSEGRHLANEFFEITSKLADTGVFVLCGTSVALVNLTPEVLHFAISAVLFCFIGRFAATVACTLATNTLKLMRDETPYFVDCKNMFMIWLSGLRGGISLVLALELDPLWCSQRDKVVIINATFIVICSLLLLCGGTTELFLVLLGMVPAEGSEEFTRGTSIRGLDLPADRLPQRIGHWVHGWLEYFLVGERVERKRLMTA